MSFLNVGFPSYLNTLPLTYFLEIPDYVKFHFKTPREINQALEEGLLHAGLASSLFYAKNSEEYLIIPDISISAVGKVKSVILYHSVPLEELKGKYIAISPETETSFGLLRIILEEFYGVYPQYIVLSTPWSYIKERERRDFSAYLAIGDEALLLENFCLFPYASDLAEIWLEKTHLPFIFALMIVKKEELKQAKLRELLKNFCSLIYIARAKGLSSLQEIVHNATLKIAKNRALSYLQHLEYDFSGLKQRAFLEFCFLLKKKKFLTHIPQLNFFEL